MPDVAPSFKSIPSEAQQWARWLTRAKEAAEKSIAQNRLTMVKNDKAITAQIYSLSEQIKTIQATSAYLIELVTYSTSETDIITTYDQGGLPSVGGTGTVMSSDGLRITFTLKRTMKVALNLSAHAQVGYAAVPQEDNPLKALGYGFIRGQMYLNSLFVGNSAELYGSFQLDYPSENQKAYGVNSGDLNADLIITLAAGTYVLTTVFKGYGRGTTSYTAQQLTNKAITVQVLSEDDDINASKRILPLDSPGDSDINPA